MAAGAGGWATRDAWLLRPKYAAAADVSPLDTRLLAGCVVRGGKARGQTARTQARDRAKPWTPRLRRCSRLAEPGRARERWRHARAACTSLSEADRRFSRTNPGRRTNYKLRLLAAWQSCRPSVAVQPAAAASRGARRSRVTQRLTAQRRTSHRSLGSLVMRTLSKGETAHDAPPPPPCRRNAQRTPCTRNPPVTAHILVAAILLAGTILRTTGLACTPRLSCSGHGMRPAACIRP